MKVSIFRIKKKYSKNYIFLVCFTDSNAEEPFLTKSPAELLTDTTSSHNIDMLFGYNSGEIYLWISDVVYNPELLNTFYDTFSLNLFWNRPIKYDANSKNYQKMLHEIRDFYFPDGIGIEALSEYSQLFNDIWFSLGIDRSAKLEVKKSLNNNIFFYRYVLYVLRIFYF